MNERLSPTKCERLDLRAIRAQQRTKEDQRETEDGRRRPVR